MTPHEAAAAIGRECSVPDDGRWYPREVIHNGLRISGLMRKRGTEPNQYTDLRVVKYEPRVITKAVSEQIFLRDSASAK